MNRKIIYNLVIIVLIIFSTQNCKKSESAGTGSTLDPEFSQYFSWQNENIITSAKSQGNLGSCGVFAAMGVCEALIKQKTGIDVDLSEQHFINGSGTWVETGVNPGVVYQFIQENGVVLESRLPYSSMQTNDLPSGNMDYFLTSYGDIALESLSIEEARKKIKESIMAYGPVAVAMDGMSDLDNYRGGIYQTSTSATAQFGHWVVIVGWQNDDSIETGGYWIIKNSWGTSWGDNGFGNIAYGAANIDRYVIMYAVYNP